MRFLFGHRARRVHEPGLLTTSVSQPFLVRGLLPAGGDKLRGRRRHDGRSKPPGAVGRAVMGVNVQDGLKPVRRFLFPTVLQAEDCRLVTQPHVTGILLNLPLQGEQLLRRLLQFFDPPFVGSGVGGTVQLRQRDGKVLHDFDVVGLKRMGPPQGGQGIIEVAVRQLKLALQEQPRRVVFVPTQQAAQRRGRLGRLRQRLLTAGQAVQAIAIVGVVLQVALEEGLGCPVAAIAGEQNGQNNLAVGLVRMELQHVLKIGLGSPVEPFFPIRQAAVIPGQPVLRVSSGPVIGQIKRLRQPVVDDVPADQRF